MSSRRISDPVAELKRMAFGWLIVAFIIWVYVYVVVPAQTQFFAAPKPAPAVVTIPVQTAAPTGPYWQASH